MDNSVIFIVNPFSGKNKGEKRIAPFLREQGYDVVLTRYAGHAEEIARHTEAGVVVAVGGDGTVNEVARGLIGTGKTLGIIPCGSGDGLALHLGISRNFKKALDVVKKGNTNILDCAEIDGKVFVSVCGVGLDAIVSDRFSKSSKRGLWTYIKEAIGTWKNFTPGKYDICLDGKHLSKKAVLITAGNSSQWGNGAKVTPLARTDDGKLDLTIVNMFKTAEIPFLAWRLMTGTFHKSRRVECFQAENITITRDSNGPAHFDGDSFQSGREIRITLLQQKLKVLVP
ncbi:MAG: YegS/Rv2252/BmrU family lipid kinase [Bacteroidales bacterium]|nr:YegS/Rv2252/BmrU family lipid kinase [Bacteroidales bacterium]